MQNSLFRTGYSTIIRESQDASCALLNRAGRSGRSTCRLAAPHGRVPRLRCGHYKKLYGRRDAGRRRLHHQPSLSRRQPPCAGHGGAFADFFPRRMGRLRGEPGAQKRYRRSGARQLLESSARNLPGRVCTCRRSSTCTIFKPAKISKRCSVPTAAHRSWSSATCAAKWARRAWANGAFKK